MTIKGKVKKFAAMSSSYISFRGPVGRKLERKLTITPKKEYPFKIESVKVRKKRKLDVVWKEVKTDTGTGVRYEFLIKNIQEVPGSCKNTISVNIDSELKEQLVIQVGGYLSAIKPNKVKKNK